MKGVGWIFHDGGQFVQWAPISHQFKCLLFNYFSSLTAPLIDLLGVGDIQEKIPLQPLQKVAYYFSVLWLQSICDAPNYSRVVTLVLALARLESEVYKVNKNVAKTEPVTDHLIRQGALKSNRPRPETWCNSLPLLRHHLSYKVCPLYGIWHSTNPYPVTQAHSRRHLAYKIHIHGSLMNECGNKDFVSGGKFLPIFENVWSRDKGGFFRAYNTAQKDNNLWSDVCCAWRNATCAI